MTHVTASCLSPSSFSLYEAPAVKISLSLSLYSLSLSMLGLCCGGAGGLSRRRDLIGLYTPAELGQRWIREVRHVRPCRVPSGRLLTNLRGRAHQSA
jgi:hypothetical protein